MTHAAAEAPSPRRPILGLILWLASVAVFTLSIPLTYLPAAMWQNSDVTALTVAMFLPTVGMFAFAILGLSALIVTIVDFYRPGPRARYLYESLIGTCAAWLISGVLFLADRV